MPSPHTPLLSRLVLSSLCLAAPTLGAAADRPNIVFLLADDLGFGDLSVQGSESIRTPNLDRLAAEGIRFGQFYVNAPICSASRTSLLTGQYPQRWRITSAITYRRENLERGMADFLPETAPSLPRQLQMAGYATGHFGKWHLGGGRDVGEAPWVERYGFDEALTQFEGLGDRILPVFSRPMRPRWGDENRHPLGVESAKLGQGSIEYVPRPEMTSRWVARTLDFITKAQQENKPFYVNLWLDDPHTPLEASAARMAQGDHSVAARYQAVVEELDRDLGRVIDFIRADPTLRQNTLIIFASDNGPERGVGSTGGLRGEKTNLYEGGIRVPLIIWAPGLIDAARHGSTDANSLILGMDFLPTILSLAQAGTHEEKIDGIDLQGVWLGTPSRLERTVCWTRPPDHPGKNGEMPDAAIRRGDWKLLVHDSGAPDELYNLAADPAETTNLAAQHPDLVRELRALLSAWRQDVGP